MDKRRLVTYVLAVLTAVAAVATAAAAPDRKPPRVVTAVMVDGDRDGRADGVRLSYSEPVRHALDRDGRYPFAVAGYRIRSVGKASGRTIPITLVERAAADGAARPAVSYRRTRPGAVVDWARNQAQNQLFRATRPHGTSPAPAPPAPTPTPPAGPNDRDGDGTPDAQDCAPDDAKIHPKAADLPDLTFADSNCDGIDGDEGKAIFVSPDGNDGNPGTKAQPKREINTAVASAAAGGYVLAASGTYQRVQTKSGVGIYGGYDPKTWKRAATLVTTITGAPEAVLALQSKNVVVQLLTAVGQSLAQPGASAYGIRASSSVLTLQRVTVRVANGANGADGTAGTVGRSGSDGDPGGPGDCNATRFGRGGLGGLSPSGLLGGRGGAGGFAEDGYDRGRSGAPAAGGADGGEGGAPGSRGQPGQPGKPGTPGQAGTQGDGGSNSTAGATWVWQGGKGEDGRTGSAGRPGGGGGGGGAQRGNFVIDGSGNGGGGGGGGGAAGTGGRGGSAGGGSFAIYLHDSTATVSAGSVITAGNGGAGGRGGNGGLPGPPGVGGKGGTTCTSEVGAGGNGGDGGAGGPGGGGGGGAGGPSIAVMKVGASTATLTETATKVGTPGAGGATGAFGSGGTPAPPGIARPVFP